MKCLLEIECDKQSLGFHLIVCVGLNPVDGKMCEMLMA